MRRLGFVSCSKTKLPHPAPAAALYSSALFRKSLLAALSSNDAVYILSALHGVVPLNKLVCPYDVTLKQLSPIERMNWAASVGDRLSELCKKGDVATFFCGEEYTRPLRQQLGNVETKVFEPLGRLSLGSRLSRLAAINAEAKLREQFREAKALLRRLARAQGGGRALSSIPRRTPWPQRGVYIFVEPASLGRDAGWRIVRIGTHAVSSGSKTSLWNRLITHRGTADGGGSHRSSIFRSHVGTAIIATEPYPEWPSSWSQGQNAPKHVRTLESELERRVSAYIARLKVLWLDVQDDPAPDSDRAYLERNLIALYSRVGFLSPSLASGWLGAHSPDWRIAASGLWNIDHILREPDSNWLDVLRSYVDVTVGARPQPTLRIAPFGWHERSRRRSTSQLALFDGHGGENGPDQKSI